MQITLELADLLFALAAVAGGASALLAGVLSLTRRPRMLDTALFVSLHAILGSILILHGLRYAGLWQVWPHLAWTDLPLLFAAPPLFYILFVARSTGDRFEFNGWSLLHAAPPLLVLFAMLPLYAGSAAEKLIILQSGAGRPMLPWIFQGALSAVLVCYLALILRPLVRLWRAGQRSSVGLVAGVFAADAILIIACGVAGQFYDGYYERLATLTLALAVSGSFFVRKWRPDFMEELGEQAAIASYRYSRLEGVDLAEAGRRIENLMAERRLYLDEALSLPDLARAVGLTPHQLSEYLNQRLGKNFYRFVNEYRVREACRQLTENPRATVLEIAFASGFNSRTSFNVAFARITGRTPVRYRREAAAAV